MHRWFNASAIRLDRPRLRRRRAALRVWEELRDVANLCERPDEIAFDRRSQGRVIPDVLEGVLQQLRHSEELADQCRDARAAMQCTGADCARVRHRQNTVEERTGSCRVSRGDVLIRGVQLAPGDIVS